jgi:hypothetical protein
VVRGVYGVRSGEWRVEDREYKNEGKKIEEK